MINLIKCHFSYLISKTTIIILSFVLLIHSVSCYIIGHECSDFLSRIQANQYYLESNLFFMKTTSILIVVFLYSYPFTTKQDNYSTLMITSNITRRKFFFTKFLTIALFLLIFLWIEVFIFVIIGSIYYPNVVIDKQSFLIFVRLYLLMLYYGLFALVLIQCFDNLYISMIPFTLYTIASILSETQEKNLLFLFLLPTITINEVAQPEGQTMLMITILFLINTLIYQKRDF